TYGRTSFPPSRPIRTSPSWWLGCGPNGWSARPPGGRWVLRRPNRPSRRRSRVMTPQPKRQGPRPLPLHLPTLSLTSATCAPALALWKSGLLPWSGPRAAAAAALSEELAGADPDQFADAVARAARARLGRFLSGVEKYRHHLYRRALADPPVVWQ